MSRETFKLIIAIGVLLYGALYLVGCLVAGLCLGNRWAVILALSAMGVSYFSYVLHFVSTQTGDHWQAWAGVVVWLSIVFGAAAGFAILFG